MVLEKTHSLILINDSDNTYQHVIRCLIIHCDHSKEQAEQCAVITHNVGKCEIKSGNFIDMFEMQNELSDKGLLVEIENLSLEF